jgi:hypothetical protein
MYACFDLVETYCCREAWSSGILWLPFFLWLACSSSQLCNVDGLCGFDVWGDLVMVSVILVMKCGDDDMLVDRLLAKQTRTSTFHPFYRVVTLLVP